MSQSSWLKLRWLFSNIFKKSLSFFTSNICLMLCFISCFKIMWWYCSYEKLTFFWSYTRDDVNYIMMSFFSWWRSTLKSFILALCDSMAQCLAARITSSTIINFCSEGIVCRPFFIEMIIQISLKVEKMLNFDSWCVCCTSLLLRRQMLTVIKNFWRFWQIRLIFFFESFLNMIMTSSQWCRKHSSIIS